MRRKPHIRIPSAEGALGMPDDLVERYRKGLGMSNLWLKTKDQELAERVKDQMPRNPDLRWWVAKSGDPEFPWGLFNELVRYGDGAMAEQEAA